MKALRLACLRPLPLSAVLLVLLAGAPAAGQGARPLDHDAYDRWLTIEDETISADGDWVLYRLTPRVGDATLVVRQPTGVEHRVDRVTRAAFSSDSRFAVFTIAPARDSLRTLRLAQAPVADLPTDTMGILDLRTGAVTRIPDVRDWTVSERDRPVVVYTLAEDRTEEANDSAGAEEPTGRGRPVETQALSMLHLPTGVKHRFSGVTEYALAEDGSRLAYASHGDPGATGVRMVETASADSAILLAGPGEYRRLAFSRDARQVAFVTDRDDGASERPRFSLYHWREGSDTAIRLADSGTEGVPAGWVVSERATPEFSESGGRLFFGTSPDRPPFPEDSLLPEERVTLDVWHWQDEYLQPMQLLAADRERERTYRAVVHLDRRPRVVQLETPAQPDVDVGRNGDADMGLAQTDVPYRRLVGIEAPGFSDVWLVDVRTGDREMLLRRAQVWPHLSPDARYVAWYDYTDRHWHALDLNRRRSMNLTAGIPHPVWDEDDDHPMPPGPYGMAGWTTADDEILIYDRFDLWAVDPDGRTTPRRVTEGFGRDNGLQLRYVPLDPEEDALAPRAPMLISALNLRTKEAGYFRDRVEGADAPRRLVLEPKHFDGVAKAAAADVLLYTREDVAEFPDLWVADASFSRPVKVSDANPQQAEYNWATAELVEWISADGVPLQGLLYRPSDFDPDRRYPMLVNFYERSSDNLHAYAPPLPHRSIIRPTFYASRGYLVFIPDVVYRDGYPGASAMSAVMPGVLKLAAEPWVDERNVGLQGHSWGGYQIAYMITRTDFFKAAEAGAPVANMTSAYGGIRWGSGMSRMFQYERTQSRIGGSLWEEPMRYLENSPLFFLDEVETPLLIMHNDEDGAVPWTQGIELFVGLRRLGKPAWMITYNGEPHWPTTAAHIRDWNIRMQQFFDHYLMGAPAPVWLAEGIPATQKGQSLGLELAEPIMAGEGEAATQTGGPDGGVR